ncbi:Iron transport multicopper oxidase FET3 [Folsomia candida]|uniref:Iron transport multicopper oxidase FET3 n=1 Tax=Folsomia candida TaxID=158441 RepID=A0A226DJZ5_FOLCA|nr:Iron transport multicopper oxidase FET3 [Folsomia candida]
MHITLYSILLVSTILTVCNGQLLEPAAELVKEIYWNLGDAKPAMMNQEENSNLCKNTKSMSLVSIMDSADQKIINRITKGANNSAGSNFWLGGSDLEQEGRWVWPDGTRIKYFNRWNSAPSLSNTQENCMFTSVWGRDKSPPPPTIVRYNFNISYINGAPDGVQTSHILTINGKFPAPTILAYQGDILEVNVINSIQDGQNVTLHWHGIHQYGTPHDDGPSQVTQCPIKSHRSYTYRFHLHQSGTFWYHSHHASQYTEGLWGGFIVRKRVETVHPYDGEFTVKLTEWYHQSGPENEAWHLSTRSQGAPPYPDSVLVNGMGRYNCKYAVLKNRTCSYRAQQMPVFHLEEGKLTKMRLINVGGRAMFNVSVDHHTLVVVEVDGIEVAKPGKVVDAVFIAPGQRYAFLLKKNEGAPGNCGRFPIRAVLRTEYLFVVPGTNINPFPDQIITEGVGMLQYHNSVPVGGSNSVPVSKEPFYYSDTIPPRINTPQKFLTDSDITPLGGMTAPSTVDQQFVLNIQFGRDSEGIVRASFNGTPFQLPSGKPILMKMLQNIPLPLETIPLRLEYMSVVQLVINNPIDGPHPMHLHGHHFWIMASGKEGDGNFDPKIHPLRLNGILRDTAMVKERSYLVLRFVADNSGVWTFHCHIDWHNLSGMVVTFIEGEDEARKNIRLANNSTQLCRDHGIIV